VEFGNSRGRQAGGNSLRVAEAPEVADELDNETSRKNGEFSFLSCLAQNGKLTITDMTDAEYDLFADFISGSSSVGDGEAATIAIASKRGFLPILDDKKGRARAAACMNGQEPSWSLDVLCHPKVLLALGNERATDAVYLALRKGRMRIDDQHAEAVVQIIGLTKAVECTCLPGYKHRSKQWLR
jgi:hypothetical protein